MILQRRRFLGGLIGLVAAPAVIRVADLMPISALPRAGFTAAELERICQLAIEFNLKFTRRYVPRSAFVLA